MGDVISPAVFNRPKVHQPNPRLRKGTINLRRWKANQMLLARERVAFFEAQDRAKENEQIADYLWTHDKPIPLFIAGGVQLLKTWALLEPLGLTLKVDGEFGS